VPSDIVHALLRQYFNIAFLMGKPQDLPAGRSQLKIGIALAMLSYLLALTIPFGVERAFLQAIVDIGCTGLVIWIGLSMAGHTARFEQAFGGLCGASMYINLAAIPLFALRPRPLTPGSSSTMDALADFVLLVWGLSLLAHVVRHTFEVRMGMSVLLSFVFFIVLSTIIAMIWPEGAVTSSSSSLLLPGQSVLSAGAAGPSIGMAVAALRGHFTML
jgi:hypothetical protein